MAEKEKSFKVVISFDGGERMTDIFKTRKEAKTYINRIMLLDYIWLNEDIVMHRSRVKKAHIEEV